MSFVYLLIGKLFAITVGVIYFKYLPRPYKVVLYIIAIALLCESYGYYISRYLKQHNAWLFNIYMPFEFLLMGFAGISLLKNETLKKAFTGLLAVFLAVWAHNILSTSISHFATNGMICGCFVLSALFLVVLVNKSFEHRSMVSQPVFWLSISTVLFYACDIPYMGLHHYMIKNAPEFDKQLININSVLDVIRYPVTAISFILLGRQKQVVAKTV